MVLSVVESVHVAPFWHGVDEHSLISVLQLTPAKPLTHAHE
jgi:hypothetical protein